MPAPCFESQIKDRIKVPPAVAKAFMNEALEGLKGGNSFVDSLKVMSEKSGLQPATINSILQRDPKVKSLTKQAIAKSGDMRKIRDAAEQFAAQLKGDASLYHKPGKIAQSWDLQRRAALAGHSIVFGGTHMSDLGIQIPTEAGRARMSAFWRAQKDLLTFKYAGEGGKFNYEMDMSLLQIADRYDAWKSASADIEPGKRNPGDILLQSRNPSLQTRNFDALKPARYSMMEQAWSQTDPALRQGETGQALMHWIARDMNYATGTIMPPRGEAATEGAKTASALSSLAGRYNILMATKLFFAKHMNALFAPLEYVARLGRATPAEAAARNIAMGRWANIVATQLGILGVNYAFNKAMGFKTPNISDPGEASTYMRLRFGNAIVPYSPMLESLRLPIIFTYAMAHKGTDSAGSVLWRTLWNAAHPAAHTLAEQVTGKDYKGQPIPSVRNLISPVKGYKRPSDVSEGAKQVGEYATTRFTPIAISGGLREFYQALRDNGVQGGMATAFIKAAVAAGISGLAGKHMFELGNEKPKSSSNLNTAPKIPKIKEPKLPGLTP